MTKPKMIVTNDSGLEYMRKNVAKLKPDTYIEHFEKGAVVILLKRRVSRRQSFTIGKIIVPHSAPEGMLEKVEKRIAKTLNWEQAE